MRRVHDEFPAEAALGPGSASVVRWIEVRVARDVSVPGHQQPITSARTMLIGIGRWAMPDMQHGLFRQRRHAVGCVRGGNEFQDQAGLGRGEGTLGERSGHRFAGMTAVSSSSAAPEADSTPSPSGTPLTGTNR